MCSLFFTVHSLYSKYADGMKNSADPEQTASVAVCSGSALLLRLIGPNTYN